MKFYNPKMKTLNYFYENPPQMADFFTRKKEISQEKTIITGPINSGKTTMAINFLINFKTEEILYINFGDIRSKQDEILQNFNKFLKQNSKIKAVVFDEINKEILKFLPNLNFPQICILIANFYFEFPNFANLKISNLDFEEFISFYKKNYETQTIFSHYLILGNGCKNPFLGDNINYLQNLFKANLDQMDIKILEKISLKINEIFSINSLFLELKNEIKISKDKIYEKVKNLQNCEYIKFANKLNSPNANKKIFFSDFSYKNVLSFKKDFKATLSNAVFCELTKLKKEIFFNNEFDFIILNKFAIIISPFSANEIIFQKFEKNYKKLKDLKIFRLKVISVANFGELEKERIKCEILPFWQFALSL